MSQDTFVVEKPVTVVKLDGTTIADALYGYLSYARVEKEFRLPARVTLRFDYPHLLPADLDETDFSPKIGTEVTITVDGTSLVKAEITSLELEADVSGRRMTVTALDKAHRLGHVTTQRTYLKGSVSSIVTDIAGRAGLSAKTDSAGDQIEWLMQVETDLDLLNGLAARTGYDWWIDDDATLNFTKPNPGPATAMELGVNLLSWRLRVREPAVSKVTVQGRQPTRRALITAASSGSASTAVAPASDLAGRLTKSPEQALLVSQVPLASANDATMYAAALRDRAAAAASRGEGQVFHSPALLPGTLVQVTGAGLGNGTFTVRSVDHQMRAGDWETFFSTGEHTPSGLTDLMSAAGPSPSTSWQQHGLVIGIVTNNKDPESLGRVKVGFSSLSADAGAAESDWARIVSVGGGDQRGNVSLPEIDDEVLVGFEHGNLQHPVVIGGLFGDKAKYPGDAPSSDGKVPTRRITSRLGHVFEMGDGEETAKKYMLMQVKDGTTLKIDTTKAELTVPESGESITLTCGQASITLKSSGEISVKGMKVSIEGTQEVDVKGAQIKVAADATLALSGEASAELKGAQAMVTGQAIAKVAAATVMFN